MNIAHAAENTWDTAPTAKNISGNLKPDWTEHTALRGELIIMFQHIKSGYKEDEDSFFYKESIRKDES